MDSGDIISQRSIKIEEDDNLDSLYSKMSLLGRDLLMDTLPLLIDGKCDRIKQDEKLVSFGLNIKKEEEKIDFSKNAIEVNNLIRGLSSVPGAFCYLDDKRLKIYKAIILDKKSDGEVGKIVDIDKDGIIVNCSDYCLKILDIKLEGKSRCMVKDYINGIKKNELIGKVLK